ncbi:putative MFS-type transporter EfpA [Baekduia alba]|uniref:MFS transporter n=1 Tax=Baekduia alba TaxID=2997333 RepID=UPI002340BC76|nr:MFS transporter [Baekduia alba]WCB92506.1 putative MFS-type transporter EfpA [Baekduia alba]
MSISPLRRGPARRTTTHASSGPSHNPALVLGIILATYLMIVLDVSVIITALPRIHTALDFSTANLSWVQSAYTLTFGGLLLLGARAGDILGRRRVFVVGIGIFTFASLLAGLAQSSTWLLAARALQGVGAAIAAPSALALLTTSFPEGHERTRALAAYSAVAGGGGSAGLVLGGMLTDWVSWRWGLFINVPIGLLMMYAAPRVLPETVKRPGRFDLTGALTSTLGMSAVVYGFVRAASDGWGDDVTMASFAAGIVLLVAFVLNERRAEQPITPLRLFASRERSGAYIARILVVGAMFGMFFFLTQYLQGVAGYSPLKAGIAFLPMTLVMFSMVQVVPRLAGRLGSSTLLIGGLALDLVGMAWLSRLSETTAFFPGIAIPMVLMGIGMGAALTPLTAAGIAGVQPDDAGAASGVVNVAHQLGGSLGLGILVTVFASAQRSAGGSASHALAHAVSSAVAGSAIFLALGLSVVLLVMRAPLPSVAVARIRARAAALRSVS